tara:strand:+ start:52 stop:654 length:603 start_codon:yes stop_codon:yes gene_type:complete
MAPVEFDPADWKTWPEWKLEEVYGKEKYKENREAANARQGQKVSNFLGSFVSNFPGLVGLKGIFPSMAVARDANTAHVQPWIIDENSGNVIANPSLSAAKTYNQQYDNFLNNYLTKDHSLAPNPANAEAIDWIAQTSNSPAAQAGFTPEQRWALQQKHRDFKSAQKAGTMDEFVEKYPQSQTAKERAIWNKIPTSMDMEF